MFEFLKYPLRLTTAACALASLGLLVTMDFEVIVGNVSAPANDYHHQGYTWMLERVFEIDGVRAHMYHSCDSVEELWTEINETETVSSEPDEMKALCNTMRGLVWTGKVLLFMAMCGSFYAAASKADESQMHRKVIAAASGIAVVLLIAAISVFQGQDKGPVSNGMDAKGQAIVIMAIIFGALHCGVMALTAIYPQMGEGDMWYQQISARMI